MVDCSGWTVGRRGRLEGENGSLSRGEETLWTVAEEGRWQMGTSPFSRNSKMIKMRGAERCEDYEASAGVHSRKKGVWKGWEAKDLLRRVL
jgi:hypothetical protein